MANIPVPRSYNTILGDMINAFRSRFGLRRLKVASPVLSTLEAAAQSDVRASQDIFNMLSVGSLDRAEGQALDRYGADEGAPRIAETAASGYVTVSDTSFTKKSSRIYQGLPAPIAGSATIYVLDASAFPASGSIYIGRNTVNYEGPLAYTSITSFGSYYALNLSSATQKYHNLNETVIVAQGGVRTIAAGTLVKTAAGNTAESIQYKVLYTASIPDGETSVDSVTVVCAANGTVGNAGIGTINQFVSSPFTGASVTNSLPFQNGLATEDDKTYRERIRAIRASRSQGTPTAIRTKVTGIVSPDENKRVASTSVVTRAGGPSSVYIDDGTGYEERWSGVATETIIASAVGGEQYFQLTQQPVTKAFSVSQSAKPFALIATSALWVKVGGVLYSHTFNTTDFQNINNATAYEVCASINANSTIQFAARTSNGGKNVVLFARADTNDYVEVVSAPSGIDANAILAFAPGRNDTLKLYKNDKLLFKDGTTASITSALQSQWGSLSSGETLTVAVDGTPAVTYTFSDTDFVNANTAYVTLNRANSLASWAAVINAKVPGITCTAANGALTLTSNAGTSSRASINISGGSLSTPSKSMFSVASATGSNNDYVLDRNRSQGALTVPLAAGDRLTAGSAQTSGFIESTGPITNVSVTNGQLWFVVDGAAQIISHGVTATTSLTFASTTINSLAAASITGPASVFSNVQAGDWVIIWDTSVNATNLGVYRIHSATGTTLVIPHSTVNAQTITMANAGIAFVRTTNHAQIQKVTVPTGTYTAATAASQLNSALTGCTASAYRTNKLRVATNTKAGGDVALVATDADGAKLLLPITNSAVSIASHYPALESGNSEVSTPTFLLRLNTAASATQIQFANTANMTSNQIVVSGYNFNGPSSIGGTYGNNHGRKFYMQSLTGSIAVTRKTPLVEFGANDNFFTCSGFSFAPNDTLNVLVDGDTSSKSYSIPMFRRLATVGTTYGTTNTFKDADNGGASLVTAFGSSYDFSDCAIMMRARARSMSGTTSAIMLRYYQYGAGGNSARVRFHYPSTASTPVAVKVDTFTNPTTDITVTLPTGAARDLSALKSTTRLGVASDVIASSGTTTLNYAVGFAISTAVRDGSNNTTLTVTLPFGTSHGFNVGDVVWVNTNNNANYASGAKTLTAVTATTLTYTESGAAVGSAALVGTVTADTTGEVLLSTLQVGDIINIAPGSGLDASDPTTVNGVAVYGGQFQKVGRVSTVGPQYFKIVSETAAIYNGGVPLWHTITPTAITAYPIDTANNAATQIATAINTLNATSNTKCPITATVVGDGVTTTGTITTASFEFHGSAGFWYSLTDGIGYVQSSTASTDYSFVFKDPINAPTTVSDWANEAPVVVPTTTASVVRWLNALAISGVSATSSVVASSRDGKISITSGTAGSAASVQVQNSSANSASAIVVGAASIANGVNYLLGSTDFRTTSLWATSGGATGTASGTVTAPDGTTTANTINAGASANTGVGQTVSGLYANTYTFSVWLKAASATEACTLVVYDQTASANIVTASFTATTTWTRFMINGAVPAGHTITCSVRVNTASHSVQAWGPQLEVGTYASPYVAVSATVPQPLNSVCQINAADATRFAGGMWVSLQNSVGNVKSGISVLGDLNTYPTTIDTSGNFIFDITGTHSAVWRYATTNVSASFSATPVLYEKQANYVLVAGMLESSNPMDLTGVKAGDYVNIVSATYPQNSGNFRIVGVDNGSSNGGGVWIENPNAVEALNDTPTLTFTTNDSVQPGDQFVIASAVFGAGNQNVWTVKSLDYTNRGKLTVDTTSKSTQAYGAWLAGATYAVGAIVTNGGNVYVATVGGVAAGSGGPTGTGSAIIDNTVTWAYQNPQLLGTNSAFVYVREPRGSKLVRQILAISPNQTSGTLADVKFTNGQYYTYIAAGLGTVMTALDKLAFPTSIATGVDSYSYSVGLIGQANTVLYGSAQDPVTYPGVVAAGAQVNIQGPLVRRITVSLGVRIASSGGITQATRQDISDAVKARVASVINATAVGQSVSISDIVNAAAAVSGVGAVSVIAPTYSSASDQIAVQPYEKALVLNLDTDILISFVGDY